MCCRLFDILVPRGRAPFGQHQESRPLAVSNNGSPRFTDFPSLCACSESSLTNLIGSGLNLLCLQIHSNPECRWTWREVAILGADQKERGLWGRECLFERTERFICQVNIFSNNLLYSTLEFLTTARMPVRGSKHLDRKRKAAIALEVKVPEDIEVHCCGKWRQDWLFVVKDLRQLSSCYARRTCKTSRKYG